VIYSSIYEQAIDTKFPQLQYSHNISRLTYKMLLQKTHKTSKTKEEHTVLGTVSPWNGRQGVLHAPILYQLQPLPPK
jgi:hypothetical protein